MAHPVLRHRVLTNFRAESEGINGPDHDQLLEMVPVSQACSRVGQAGRAVEGQTGRPGR